MVIPPFILTFHAASRGVNYTAETTIDLESWTTDGVIILGLGAENQRTATIPLDERRRFMRIVVEEAR